MERQLQLHNTNMATREQLGTLHNKIIISKTLQAKLAWETSQQQLLIRRTELTKLPPSSNSERKPLR